MAGSFTASANEDTSSTRIVTKTSRTAFQRKRFTIRSASQSTSTRRKLWVADWPTCDGKPMLFLGQVKPPKNEVTEELLEWVCTLYLFGADSAEGMRYKVVTQDRGAQTAEEHYELEEQLCRND